MPNQTDDSAATDRTTTTAQNDPHTPINARPVVTNDDPSVALCTMAGDATAEHDYRPYTYKRFNKPHTSWRCVWCHTVACGDYDEPDPCWLPYHHSTAHRSRAGVVWPLGGNRPHSNPEVSHA